MVSPAAVGAVYGSQSSLASTSSPAVEISSRLSGAPPLLGRAERCRNRIHRSRYVLRRRFINFAVADGRERRQREHIGCLYIQNMALRQWQSRAFGGYWRTSRRISDGETNDSFAPGAFAGGSPRSRRVCAMVIALKTEVEE
jgi:hypothetical protein